MIVLSSFKFLSFFLSSSLPSIVCLFLSFFLSFILPSWHGLVQSVPLKSVLLAWLIQERILFWLVFARLNAHFYRRCWKWDPCESLHFCAHVIMLRYTLNKTVTSVVPYCALCCNTAIGKFLSKHCMCFLDGFYLHICFHYGIPFLQRIQHSGEETNAMHKCTNATHKHSRLPNLEWFISQRLLLSTGFTRISFPASSVRVCI